FALSEPEAGSDAGSLKTTAVRDGGGWRLNGTKTFITNMGVADLYIIMARTDPDVRGAQGVSAFIVTKEAEGLEFGQPMETMGLQCGKAITDKQAIQFMIADRYTEIEAALLLTLRAATACDRGEPFTRLASMAKLMSTDIAMKATTDALQMFGGYGYIKEYPA